MILMEDIFDKVKKSFPKTEGTHQLDGIDDVIEIYWDKWGIPHVYAKSLKDCFFTIGYIHASHRLWQMELLRRLISGELSEIVGKDALNSDMHYRIIGLHRIAKNAAEKLSENKNSEMHELMNSYNRGVNTRIEELRENPPLEFLLLNLKINEWKIEDSLKIICYIDWGLSNWNYPMEILREKLILKLGRESANKIIPLYSGMNLNGGSGSNEWAVGPAKSSTNSVLFANDPHLPLTLPVIWFLLHVNCPEINAIGSTFPGLPLIVLGHNEKIAWGCTNVHADTLDLFKLKINPNNKNQYEYNGEWKDFKIIEEPIKIKDHANQMDFKVYMTEYGPVIKYYELDDHLYELDLPGVYALRWLGYDGDLIKTIEGFIELNKAGNWNEFRNGLSKLTINPQNFLYGDVDGNFGIQQGGRIPIRNFGDGATITPGLGDNFNWKGFVGSLQLVSIYNPKEGFVFNANYNENRKPNNILLARDTDDPYRHARIKSLLNSKQSFTLNDLKNFQLDYYSEEASKYLPEMLKILKTNQQSEKFNKYIEILESWDYILRKNSIAATIYKVWVRETLKLILNPLIGEDLTMKYLGRCPFELLKLFEMHKNKESELARLLLESLTITINYLSKKISEDFNNWKWGKLHQLILSHPFADVDENARILNAGKFNLGGDAYTLNNGYYDPIQDFRVIIGPSFRQLHDLSDWSRSLCIIPGGQSGLPFHEHYKDLIRLWVKGKYIPMLFHKEEILKNLKGIFKIVPKPKTKA